MNTIEVKAGIIDLTARIESLEAFFISYIRISERRSVSCQMVMTFYETYLDILRKKLASLSDAHAEQIEKCLTSRMEDAEAFYKHYEEWMELADSVEEFENGSKFEQHARGKR
jgi:hypothetical protein